MIIALAGRRIDAPDAETPRFPESRSGLIRERLRDLFRSTSATALVGSGACGADLLAMEAAGELGLRRCLVLPFEPARFRETSVVDRPGDWGPLFDRILADAGVEGGVIVLENPGDSHSAYAAVNRAILDEAIREAGPPASASDPGVGGDVLAVIVWDGAPRGADDLTAGFADEARSRGLRIFEISTL